MAGIVFLLDFLFSAFAARNSRCWAYCLNKSCQRSASHYKLCVRRSQLPFNEQFFQLSTWRNTVYLACGSWQILAGEEESKTGTGDLTMRTPARPAFFFTSITLFTFTSLTEFNHKACWRVFKVQLLPWCSWDIGSAVFIQTSLVTRYEMDRTNEREDILKCDIISYNSLSCIFHIFYTTRKMSLWQIFVEN